MGRVGKQKRKLANKREDMVAVVSEVMAGLALVATLSFLNRARWLVSKTVAARKSKKEVKEPWELR